jgi:hypothetical protein
MDDKDLYRERTTLRTIITMMSAIIAGGFFLYFAMAAPFLMKHPNFQSLVREFGALLIASVSVALLWELASKRAFLAELMNKAKMAEEVRSAGLIRIVQDFNRDIEWPQLLKTVQKLDIFFAYGETWRNNNAPYLEALAQRPNVRLRMVLPDPNDSQLMTELGRRFETAPGNVQKRINESTEYFKRVFGNTGTTKVEFSLWYLPESPVFSFYRFDDIAILALYKHAKGRGKIMTFVVEAGGTLYEFVRSEFNEFIRLGGTAKLIYTTKNEINV